MRHIKLRLEYDGANYAGWQSQVNATAIQDVLARALSELIGSVVPITGASRTDSGVHALGQVASFKTESQISCDGFHRGLNTFLPPDIRVVHCEEVADDFHPILGAKAKTYRYLIDRGASPSAIWNGRAWWVGPELDVKGMEEGSKHLIGEHDFKSFQGALTDTKTSVRTLHSIRFSSAEWFRPLLCIDFNGNGFLKYMIRNLVGTLVEIGLGKRTPEEIQTILLANDRRKAGQTAPPQGLYLVNIEY